MSLTSANSVLSLGVKSLFPVAQQIQGYATDEAFMTEDVETGESQMGVDGNLSAGFTPYKVPLEITLQADSASVALFEALSEAERVAKEKYELFGSILVRATNTLYTFRKGYVIRASLLPPGKKILQPRKWTIDFQSCSPAPV